LFPVLDLPTRDVGRIGGVAHRIEPVVK
jgi:hypothetical protein